jgi:hypothetical protein
LEHPADFGGSGFRAGLQLHQAHARRRHCFRRHNRQCAFVSTARAVGRKPDRRVPGVVCVAGSQSVSR